MVYLVGDLENARAFMLMKYGTKGFYDRSYNLVANKHLAPCYPLDGRNLYKVVKLDEDFLNDLVIVIVPFTHIASMTEEHRTKLNNILKSYKDWQNLDPYQARLVVDRLLSSKDVKSNSDLKQLQKNVSGYSSANGYHAMREDWSTTTYRKIEQTVNDCFNLYKDIEFTFKDAIPLKYTPLTLLDFTNSLVYKDRGIFLEMGLVRVNGGERSFSTLMHENEYNGYVSPVKIRDKNKERLYKSYTRSRIQEWKSTHQKVVERAKYGESEWLHRDLSEIVTPQPNTKIIYVCYLPETGVIKVGRTRNWGSRKGVYSRFKGDSKLTSGIMRLCYYWNVISTGDEVVDRFLMYCAEDHLKLLANHRMRVVEGKEFFKGYDLNDFIREVRSYFESLSVSRLISIRDTSKIKRFCSGESYDYERLMQRLQELKEKN